MQHPAAKAAVQKEWDGLLEKNTWEMPKTSKDVVFYDQVVRECKISGKAIHPGRLFDICVLKGSELPEGHINRKWKGRVVLGGNNVQDEFGLAARHLVLRRVASEKSGGHKPGKPPVDTPGVSGHSNILLYDTKQKFI